MTATVQLNTALDREIWKMRDNAEAMQKMNQQGMAEMVIKVLPEIVRAAAEPIGQIDSLNVYSGGAEGGASEVMGLAPAALKQAFDVVRSTTGVDLAEVMRADTIEAKVRRDIDVHGLSGVGSEMLGIDAHEGFVEDPSGR
jgi:flotillin